jgi:hypothetical protein
MSMHVRTHVALALGLALVVSAPAIAQEPAGQKPDEKAMMDAWMKYASPGEGHKKLASSVGTWDVKVQSWMAPGAQPNTSTGTSEVRWVLGGRYLEERFRGNMMEQPFEGIGYTGYDNFRKEYVATWMDSMSTAMMRMTGKADAGGKTMTFTGTMDDLMTGKPAQVRSVFTEVSPDHHMHEMYTPAPDGREFKTMEMHYTRKK